MASLMFVMHCLVSIEQLNMSAITSWRTNSQCCFNLTMHNTSGFGSTAISILLLPQLYP